MCSYGPADTVDQDFMERLEIIFGSPASLNGSFLTSSDPCTLSNSGIDMSAWKAAADKIKSCSHDSIVDVVLSSITKSVEKNRGKNQTRLGLILGFYKYIC
jgi:hypothetical protein